MSDLISRSELLALIQAESKADRPEDFKVRNIQRIVEDMAAAYRVESVIKEMEREIEHWRQVALEWSCKGAFKTAKMYEHRMSAFCHAVDIVKRGYSNCISDEEGDKWICRKEAKGE